MKKIVISLFLFALHMGAQDVDQSLRIARIKEECDRVKNEAVQKYDEYMAYKTVLLSTEQGQEYIAARQNWFKSRYGNESAFEQATQRLQTALVYLQKLDIYNYSYLPALESCLVNEQKFYVLQRMLGVRELERLNLEMIDSAEDRMVYAMESMNAEGISKLSKLWLELSYDRNALSQQIQQELWDFIEGL